MPSFHTPNTAVKDKLPVGFVYNEPLYYCSDDDTLWLSPKDRDLHWHSLRIGRVYDLIAAAEKKMKDLLAQMSVCKSKTYPQIQKDIDALNARLRKLMMSRDWRETNTGGHGALRSGLPRNLRSSLSKSENIQWNLVR